MSDTQVKEENVKQEYEDNNTNTNNDSSIDNNNNVDENNESGEHDEQQQEQHQQQSNIDFTSDDFDTANNTNNNNNSNNNNNNSSINNDVDNSLKQEYEEGNSQQHDESSQNQDDNENNSQNQDQDDDNSQNGNTDGDYNDNLNQMEPEQFRKLFIGSLNYITTEETLRSYFSKFGDIVDCVIMKEAKTNKSRGFGFVTYSRSTMIDEVMKHRPHSLDGRDLETKRATPREEAGKPGAELTTKKLFVGAIKEGLTEDQLKDYFQAYGNVTDCVIMREKESNKSRGFGFVSFDDYDPVDKIVLEKYHTINGQSVAVKKALPKDQAGLPNKPQSNLNQFSQSNFRLFNNLGGGNNQRGSGGNHAGGSGGMMNNMNIAMMAQKMFSAMQNFQQGGRGNKRMGGHPGRGQGGQTNFAADDFEGFEGFGNRNNNNNGNNNNNNNNFNGGPMRQNNFRGRSNGPYGGGYGRRKNN